MNMREQERPQVVTSPAHPAPRPAARTPPPHPQPAAEAPPQQAAQQAEPDDTAEESVVPELHLRLGAERFVQGDMEAARKHFRAVADHAPDHSMAPFAAYKLAWSEANLGEFDAAIIELERVIAWLRDDERPEVAVTLREAEADLAHFRSRQDSGP